MLLIYTQDYVLPLCLHSNTAMLVLQLREDVSGELKGKAKATSRRKFMGDGAAGAGDEEFVAEDIAGIGEEELRAGESEYIPAKISKRILEEARAQQLDGEDEFTGRGGAKKRVHFGGGGNGSEKKGAVSAASSALRRKVEDDDEEDEEDDIVEFAADDGECEAYLEACDCRVVASSWTSGCVVCCYRRAVS